MVTGGGDNVSNIPTQRVSDESPERQYLRLQWKKLRDANKKASDASREWDQLNEDFMDLARRSGWTDDVFTLNQIKSRNIGLNDALSTLTFWQQESQRISSLILAEKAIRELLGADIVVR